MLEAMVYGRPVIGSRVEGIPEMIVYEEHRLLFTRTRPMKTLPRW